MTIGCVVSELRERPLKSGNGRMAFGEVEDQSARVELLIFSRVFAASEEALKSDEPLVVRAVVQHEGDGENVSTKLRAESIVTLASVREEQTAALRLTMEAEQVTVQALDRLEPLFLTSADGLPVEVAIDVPDEGRVIVTLGAAYRLRSDDETVARVERITGRDSVGFQGRRGA